jgi:2-methylcitrate dehydratase PrpD
MNEDKMLDQAIASLQDKIIFDPNPARLPDRFPHRHGGTVTIRMKNGQEFSSTCNAPRGSGPRGVDWADVETKYRSLVPFSGLSARQIEESLALVRGFETGSLATKLTSVLTVRN